MLLSRLLSLILIFVSCNAFPKGADQLYIAFSLREAQRRLDLGNSPSSDLMELGGITRIVGMIHDQERKDVILLGRAIHSLPLGRFDDLVLALRSRLVHDDWPMVSIDPTEETKASGLQKVVFRGNLVNTSFGRDLLDSDVLLKNYSLELVAQIEEITSYKSLCLNAIARQIEAEGVKINNSRWLSPDTVVGFHQREVEGEEACQVRFWFFPIEPYRFVARDGVFCIEELRLGVSAIVIYAHGSKSPQNPGSSLSVAASTFSQQITKHYQELSTAYPTLRRLKILYDFVAVSEGIRNLQDPPDFSYLLKDYQPEVRETADNHPLIQVVGAIDRSDQATQAFEISGGIELKTKLEWLNYGDVSPLKEIVIVSRPHHGALMWPVPLAGWDMPNAKDLDLGDRIVADVNTKNVGFSVSTISYVLNTEQASEHDQSSKFSGFQQPPPPAPLAELKHGGIDIAIRVADAFEAAELDSTKTDVLRSRTSNDSLFWDIKSKKKE